jgi:hypothetical protein
MASTSPGPARDLVTHAIDTAISGDDAVTYDSATAQLATQPIGGQVLGDVLRSLLEDTHPDRLNSDDITLVIGRCYRAAATWLLVADLLPFAPATLASYLETTFAEYAREAREELP